MKTLLSVFCFLLFISTSYALPPSEGTREVMAHYKETYDFENWPGKDTPLIAAPDLKQHEIPSLVGAYEIFGDSAEGVLCEFYSDSPEDEYVVRFFTDGVSNNPGTYMLHSLLQHRLKKRRNICCILFLGIRAVF